MSPEISLLFVHGEAIGYGRYGVHLAQELQKAGVEVYDHLEEPEPDPAMEHLNRGRRSKKTNVVAWVSVPTHARGWYRDQHAVISSMWESSQLPESFRETLHEFNQVIVPSWQNQELFSRYHDNVAMVPLGVDPEVWSYKPREVGAEFRFLCAGSGPRKGVDLASKAFRKVFKTWPKDSPRPVLVLKNPRGEDYYGERIEMIAGRIDPQEEVDLYASAHCYLQPSRGEGFGLQPLQAIAQGMPTILTAAHGHDSFAHLGRGISASMTPSAYFIYGDAGEWWEPNFDELCEQMEFVYQNYDQAVSEAREASAVALREFTWAETARKFIHVLRDELEKPFAGGEWFVPSVKRYLVMVNRPWTADIAGRTYYFKPGKEYRELADVKRILFEAGLLDPACLKDEDTGLTEFQLRRLEDYSASHSYCSECGQKLGTGITKADVIEKELINAS